MKEKTFECEVVKELQESPAGGGVNRLRIVRWIVDGRPGAPQLEKRNFFMTQSGEERAGKLKGLTKADLAYVVERWGELQGLLG